MTILLVAFLNVVDINNKNEYEILEFYAGARRISKLASGIGVPSRAMDCLYDHEGDNIQVNNCMDINTSGGFTYLSEM